MCLFFQFFYTLKARRRVRDGRQRVDRKGAVGDRRLRSHDQVVAREHRDLQQEFDALGLRIL